MNSVDLTGRMAYDPELKYSPNGTPYCNFSIAVDRPYKHDEVDFIDCVAFNKPAENIAQYFAKGDGIETSGSLQTSSYEKDGKKYKSVKVMITQWGFPKSKKSQQSSSQEPQNRSEWDSLGDEINVNGSTDDGIPF
jgi:single-strand DNA-binding protein